MMTNKSLVSTRNIANWSKQKREATSATPAPSGPPAKKPCGCHKNRPVKENGISVIVTCHNYGRFLAECLDSILAQTHKPDEIIVVLDSCTDDSGAIAGRYRGQGVRTVEIKSRDVYLARRAGLHRTSSSLLLFMDADDVFPPTYLADLLPGMADPRVGIVTGRVETFGISEGGWNPDVSRDIRQMNCATSASLVRRKALTQAGGLSDWSQVGVTCQDWHTWQAVVEAGWTIAKADTFYHYRRHGHNSTIFRHEPARPQPAKSRVLFVTPCLGIGGVERHLLDLLKQSRRIEWSATLIHNLGYSDDEAVKRVLEYMPVYGSDVLCPRVGENSSFVIRRETDLDALRELEQQTDVIYAWGAVSPLLKATKLPVVYAVHCSGQWGRDSTAACAPFASRIIATSDYVRSFVPVEHRHKVTLIPNGTEVSRLAVQKSRVQMRAEWGVPEGRKAIAFVGRWSAEKNPLALAEAIAVLGEDYHAVYCGPQSRKNGRIVSSSDRKRAEELCGGRITWTYTTSPGDIYNAVDAVVLPSHDEASSMTAGEALSSGCPLVATPVGHLPELERKFPGMVQFVPLRPSGEQLAAGIRNALCACHIARIPAIQQYMLENCTSRSMVDQWENELIRAARKG